MQALANAVDADVNNNVVPQTKTRVDETIISANSSATSGTTESGSLASITVAVESGKTYKIGMNIAVASTVGGDIFACRLRDGVGGTQVCGPQVYCATAATLGYPLSWEFDYSAVSTGSKTFHLQLQRTVGSGAGSVAANTGRESRLYVDKVIPV
jgi:hypothetical protein